MKKVLMLTMVLLLVSGVCAASPLTDYSQGKAAIDITFNPNQDVKIGSEAFDGKSSNLDGNITVGVGNRFAVQYRQSDSEATSNKLNIQEFNVFYKVNKHVSTYTGFAKTYYSVLANDGMELKGPNNNHWQVGFLGSALIYDKTTAYGIISTGKDIRNWEVGVSYAFAKNMELNILYRDYKAENLSWGGSSVDARVKGLGYGLTFKF